MSMSTTEPRWPQKTRELHNHHFDSTIWNDFQFRDDDIVISTYAKSGTTWVQQIVAQLLFAVGPPIEPPTGDIRQYFLEWLDRDGHPFWPFWENIRSWWAIRQLPNVRVVHFAALKGDMPREIRGVADFLDIPVDPAR